MRGKGNEKAPMRCCTGADILLFAFLINWRNLIQYEYYGKADNGGYAYNAGHGIMAIHGKAIGYKPEEEDEYGGKNLPQRALEKLLLHNGLLHIDAVIYLLLGHRQDAVGRTLQRLLVCLEIFGRRKRSAVRPLLNGEHRRNNHFPLVFRKFLQDIVILAGIISPLHSFLSDISRLLL